MYGILAACIAVMAMFLGLFALSVEFDSKVSQQDLQKKAAIETVQLSLDRPATR